jgi:Icc-related predicted phosphoesterase
MITICAISDTHLSHNQLDIPECDLLIHAGDFSFVGKMVDVLDVNQWFGKLKAQGKIKEAVIICGNHDWVGMKNPSWTKEAFTNCHYLDEESIELFNYKIFGSAWTPEFNNWAFNAKRGKEIARHWKKITEDVEILITHGPPHKILDINTEEIYSLPLGPEHLGCEELAKKVKKLENLKLHVFGHIHSSSGEQDINGVKFVNASVLNESYQVVYPPRIIHLEK